MAARPVERGPGQVGHRRPARQLQKGKRVSSCFGEAPAPYALVDPPWGHRVQQRTSVPVVQAAQIQFGKPFGRGLVILRRPHREDKADRLRHEASRHNAENLCRHTIEPLRIVDQADRRPLLGHHGQVTEERQAEQKPVRRCACGQTECDAEGVSLRAGQVIRPRARIHRAGAARRTEAPSWSRCRQPGLPGSRPRSPRDGPAGRYADACLAAQHESGALSGSCARHQLVKRSALRAPAKHPYTTISPTQAPPASVVPPSTSARLSLSGDRDDRRVTG